jgi:penicillin-binding protein 2
LKLIEKITNRYNILVFVVVILMSALGLRLATLTVAQGDYYRDISDNKRLKEIYTTSPRGEIRDRYGRLLAGNKPSFTVQILKDEFNIRDRKKKNNTFLSLVRLLEEDGVSYVDEFPIGLNIFRYKNEEDYVNESSTPNDKIVDIIIEDNMLGELLGDFYKHPDYEEHYKFATAERALHALRAKGINVPINIKKNDLGIEFEYDQSIDVNNWKKENNISLNLGPIDTIIKLINQDRTIIRKVIDHPISRKLIYEKLVSTGKIDNITMLEYSLIYDEEYTEQKRILKYSFPYVTDKSTAKEDFINIVASNSIKAILEKVVVKTNSKGKEEIFAPGKILIDKILEKDENLPITLELSEDNTTAIYRYTGSDNIGDKTPLDILISYGEDTETLGEFIVDESIKSIAQEQLLKDGINTKISIAKDFEYVAINNKNNWYTANDIDEYSKIKDVFEQLKEKYEIDKKLSTYESRSIMSLYGQLTKQGHMAYQPINIAYGIKNSTVAKIEEEMDLPGIYVSIEPVRYYPEGETAAHILGSLGKISTSDEIQKYVVDNKYSPNDIIGKTGVEESYEDSLRGENGIKRVQVDVFGNTTNVLDEKKPTPGNNLYLTIDLKLQKIADAALKKTLDKISTGGVYDSEWGDYKFGINRKKNRPFKNATSGAVVAINVKTGELLAMSSYPAYDPNLFSTGISSTDWMSLFPKDDKDPLAPRPLLNIATQTAVQPGSTFKMVTGLAALDKGLSAQKKIRDMGYVEIGNQPFRCLVWTNSKSTHGYENLYEALRDSCNYYFYTLALGRNQRTGEDIGVKVEIEDIVSLSKQLGLNDKTGIEINIPTEASGGVPNPEKKISITRNLLKSYLRKDIRNYVKEDVKLTDDEITEIIEDIISWTNLEEPLTRGEVIRRLTAFGIEPEKKLSGEREGIADKIKYTYLNQAGWNISDTLYVTIGQGQSSYTPIQMANMIATLSNGGYRHNVNLVDNVKNYNNSKTLYQNEDKPERIKLNDYNSLNEVMKGMLMVSQEGTSKGIFSKFPIKVGSKTGTAEKSGINPVTGDTYDDFAWFVGFAPYEEPEIAIAAVIFQGGSGGYAAPMTRDIIAEYLGLNAIETKDKLPFKNTLVE